MSTAPALDPSHTALVVLDCQRDPGRTARRRGPRRPARPPGTSPRRCSRQRRHCRLRPHRLHRSDWDAIPATNKAFFPMAQHRVLHDGDPATAIHDRLAPQAGDITIRKTRHGGLATTGLAERLLERGITALAVAGVSTSGSVLSTVLDAADRDYQLYVLSDAVADPDAEAHNILIHRVLPARAHVIDTVELRTLLQAG